jgi:sec-independent protein translocase protein TatA
MGDVAQGIKAFKKGMSEDDTAKHEAPQIEPGKAEAAKTVETTSAGAKSHVS